MSTFFRSEFEADTRGDAEKRLKTLYGRTHLSGPVSGYAESAVGDAAFSVTELRIDGRFDAKTELSCVVFALSAYRFHWELGRTGGDLGAMPAVFQPGRPTVLHSPGERQLTSVVRLDLDSLSDFAAAVYGAPTPVSFEGAAPISDAAGRRWKTTATFLRDSGVLDNTLTRASAYRLLALTSLESFRLIGDRATFTVTAEARLRAYRRAYQFIDDHASLPITTADIAAAAGLSEVDLTLAFRAHSSAELTPYEELRRARLAAAHRDLLAGDPTRGDTVQSIAAQWGFPHPGRFAALYRAAYHANPKEDLDR